MADNAMLPPFDLNAVEEALSYKNATFYHTLDQKFAATKRLFSMAREAGAQGVYLFQVSRTRTQAAVFLASAETAEQARKIHRSLWNMGKAPFVIVILPDQVRIYSGFQYSSQNLKLGLLDTFGPDSLEELGEMLRDFRAASINSGTLWRNQRINEGGRVDHSLLTSLEKLGLLLRKKGLSVDIANKLIGKSIFLRYLIDRGIITADGLRIEQGIELDKAFGRNASLGAFQELLCFLDKRFNGSIFPIDFCQAPITDDHVSQVAGTLMGDVTIGNEVQLHLDFKAFEFQFIAIETLSSIYERFIRTEDMHKGVPKSQGKASKQGIVYTPEYLADYLIEEMAATKPLQPGMKIIDPACGSGVFLVLVYRRLIEMANVQAAHDPEILKKILTTSVYGIEREEGACDVTELSLILTLLDYLNPEDLDTGFKFPNLRGHNIFQCDFFDEEQTYWKHRFDWVIGNPPWIDLKGLPVSDEVPFRKWMKNHQQDKPLGDTRVSEGFLWRTPAMLAPKGLIGLMIHAKTLTNHKSQAFRSRFFAEHRIHRATNFANMRRVLFSGRAIAPAATLIFQPGPADAQATMAHFSPFLVNQEPFSKKNKGQLWTLTVSSNEIQTLPHKLIETGGISVWKAALWGHCETHLRNIERIKSLCPMFLDDLCSDQGWDRPDQAPEFRAVKEKKKQEIPQIKKGQLFRLVDFSKRADQPITFFDNDSFEPVPKTDYWLRRGEITNPACKVALHPSWTYQVFSKDSFVMRPRQICLGGPSESENHLRALTLYLNTSIVRYGLFFQVPDWGLERDRVTLKEVRKIPVPAMSREQILRLAERHRDLVRRDRQGSLGSAQFRAEVDQVIAETLDFPDYFFQEAREFFEINLTLNDRRTGTIAVQKPSHQQLRAYSEELATELNHFMVQGNLSHRVHLLATPSQILCTVSLEETGKPLAVRVENSETNGVDLDAFLEQHSQWAYIRRNLRVFEPHRVRMIKPARLMDWTPSQARRDAGEIFAEVITEARHAQ